MGMVRAYLGMSLDGFVAGRQDELAWLEGRASDAPPVATTPWSEQDPGEVLDFDTFLDGVGAILMGRRTFDIVERFDAWPYRDIPMLVATHRAIDDARETVRAAAGDLPELIRAAQHVAESKDVYVDGAQMVRETLDAGLLDHLVVTIMPTVLGDGISLFGGLTHPRELTVEKVARFSDGLVQLHLGTRP